LREKFRQKIGLKNSDELSAIITLRHDEADENAAAIIAAHYSSSDKKLLIIFGMISAFRFV